MPYVCTLFSVSKSLLELVSLDLFKFNSFDIVSDLNVNV